MNSLSSRIFLVLVMSLCFATANAAECRQAAVPAGAKVKMIAPDMNLNGVQQTIREFNSNLSVTDVLTFYRNLWASLANSDRPGSLEETLDEWRLISTVDGECFTTVQVKPDSKGSYALVSVLKKPGVSVGQKKLGANFPILPGSKVLNDVDYADGVRNARTIVLSNRSDMAANVAFYRNEFTSRGWVAVLERQPEVNGKPTHVMLLKKGLEETSIVISRSGGQVNVVANVVDRP
jgi:hypothetical protein